MRVGAGYDPRVPEDDWDLLFAWREGDKQAADRLVSRYFKVLTRFFGFV